MKTSSIKNANLSLLVALISFILSASSSVFAGSVPASKGELEDAVCVYRQRQIDATPSSVLQRLKDGNRRFTKGRSNHGGYPRNTRERVHVSAQGQRPLAAILTCIDSRTTPELVFDTQLGTFSPHGLARM